MIEKFMKNPIKNFDKALKNKKKFKKIKNNEKRIKDINYPESVDPEEEPPPSEDPPPSEEPPPSEDPESESLGVGEGVLPEPDDPPE